VGLVPGGQAWGKGWPQAPMEPHTQGASGSHPQGCESLQPVGACWGADDARWGYGMGLGVEVRSREMLKQERLPEKNKKGLSATAGVTDGSQREDFLCGPEAWKQQWSGLRSPWGLRVETVLGAKGAVALGVTGHCLVTG